MEMINGFKIIIKKPMPINIRRSVFDRMFKTPWNPFRKYDVKYDDILEDGQVVKTFDSLIMNAKTYEDLKRTIEG